MDRVPQGSLWLKAWPQHGALGRSFRNGAQWEVLSSLGKCKLIYFFFLVVLGIELRTLWLLGKHSATWAMPSPFNFGLFSRSHTNFRSDFEIAKLLTSCLIIWGPLITLSPHNMPPSVTSQENKLVKPLTTWSQTFSLQGYKLNESSLFESCLSFFL
jgi:hypothetical protein